MKYILRSLLFALMVFISQLSFAQKKFAHPERVRYDGSCMTIEGKDVFVYSAAFHYFRCPEELWRDRFRQIKEAGFNTRCLSDWSSDVCSSDLRRPDLIRSRLMSLGTGMKGPCRLVWTIRLILIFLT